MGSVAASESRSVSGLILSPVSAGVDGWGFEMQETRVISRLVMSETRRRLAGYEVGLDLSAYLLSREACGFLMRGRQVSQGTGANVGDLLVSFVRLCICSFTWSVVSAAVYVYSISAGA